MQSSKFQLLGNFNKTLIRLKPWWDERSFTLFKSSFDFQRLDANLIKLPSSGWVCGGLRWVLSSCEMCSAWAYVWISVDRYLAIMKPNWYRVNGKKEKVKPLFLIFTVVSVLMCTPALILFHRKIFQLHCLDEDMNNAYVCYWSNADAASFLDIYAVVIIFLVPLLLVVLFNTISGVSLIKRYLQKKKKERSATKPSDAKTTTTASNSASNDRKITIMMFTLAYCFLIFICLWNIFDYVFTAIIASDHLTGDSSEEIIFPYKVYKQYELLRLAGHIASSLNGIVNGLVLQMFPTMREALGAGLKQIFSKGNKTRSSWKENKKCESSGQN